MLLNSPLPDLGSIQIQIETRLMSCPNILKNDEYNSSITPMDNLAVRGSDTYNHKFICDFE